jgi:hypothetical protein
LRGPCVPKYGSNTIFRAPHRRATTSALNMLCVTAHLPTEYKRSRMGEISER